MGADGRIELTPRPVAASVDELLADATAREPFVTNERRSGSQFERVWIDGEPLVLKLIELDHDFTMRASGDIGCRPVRAYEAGFYDVAGDAIDHAVVGAARGVGRNGWGGALLMRDVSADLVPPGDDPFPEEQHLRFLDHLAVLAARTWEWHDDLELLPYSARWSWFSPCSIDAERELGWPEAVPRIAAEGWDRFASRVDPTLVDQIHALRLDPLPFVDAMRTTPSCFLHGDWKAANLGSAADGRTVLVDWAYVGAGPICHELGWYLALNRAKLPCTKEACAEQLRSALERHGIDTAPWWDRQLALALLGGLVEFGWEKAYDRDEELGWWCDRAREGLALL